MSWYKRSQTAPLTEILYFGSTKQEKIDKPRVEFAGSERSLFFGVGIYAQPLSSSGKQPYSYNGTVGGWVYPVMFDLKNPLGGEEFERIKNKCHSNAQCITKLATESGYDGVILRNGVTGEVLEAVAFRNDQVSIAAEPYRVDKDGNKIPSARPHPVDND